MFPAATMPSCCSTSGSSHCSSSSQPPSQRLKPCGVRVLQARATSRPLLGVLPRPGHTVCVATRSGGSGSGSSGSSSGGGGGGGGNPLRKVRREAVGGASKSQEVRVNGSRTPVGKGGSSSADEDPLDAEQEQGFVVSDLLKQPPIRRQQQQQEKQQETVSSSSSSSSGRKQEEEQKEEVPMASALSDSVSGEALTSSSMDPIETSTLLGRVKDVQQKNTELQKQLNETVALLGVAARALEDRQAAQASGAMNDALGDARTPEEGGVGSGAAVLGDSLEEDEAMAAQKGPSASVSAAAAAPAPASAGEGGKAEGAEAPADGLEGSLEIFQGPMEEERSPEMCVMQHPGIVCCTETSVARDPSGGACAITMRTVASRHGGGGASVNLPHMVALAAQAMQSSAAEFSQSNNRGLAATVYTERRMERHRQIRRVLQRGDVVEVLASNTSQFGHENFVVVLQDPEDPGLTFKAIFKPRIEGAEGPHASSSPPLPLVSVSPTLLPPYSYSYSPTVLSYRTLLLSYSPTLLLSYPPSPTLLPPTPIPATLLPSYPPTLLISYSPTLLLFYGTLLLSYPPTLLLPYSPTLLPSFPYPPTPYSHPCYPPTLLISYPPSPTLLPPSLLPCYLPFRRPFPAYGPSSPHAPWLPPPPLALSCVPSFPLSPSLSTSAAEARDA